MRRLARDESIDVAAPILTQSSRLTDEDLLEIATDKGQDRLLAISKRAVLSEKVGDVLVARGDREVVLSVTRNQGARFSNTGYGRLVDKSIDDEVLAICVGMRKDIPREHFHMLIAKASKVVFEKLVASNPAAACEVQKVLTGITGQEAAIRPRGKRDYRAAEAQVEIERRSGKSIDWMVQELRRRGRIRRRWSPRYRSSAARRASWWKSRWRRAAAITISRCFWRRLPSLSWETAQQICILRQGIGLLSPHAIEAARAELRAATAGDRAGRDPILQRAPCGGGELRTPRAAYSRERRRAAPQSFQRRIATGVKR